jgi:hypothetical protein
VFVSISRGKVKTQRVEKKPVCDGDHVNPKCYFESITDEEAEGKKFHVNLAAVKCTTKQPMMHNAHM